MPEEQILKIKVKYYIELIFYVGSAISFNCHNDFGLKQKVPQGGKKI